MKFFLKNCGSTTTFKKKYWNNTPVNVYFGSFINPILRITQT